MSQYRNKELSSTTNLELGPFTRIFLRLEEGSDLPEGRSIWISIPHQRGNLYTQKKREWVSDRNKTTYDKYLFGAPTTIKEDVPKEYTRKNLFGPGKVVVDLGSGQATALKEYSKEFPNTIFIGIDSCYRYSPQIDTTQSGVQLIKDNWSKLNSIPANSVDTILSVEGGFTWSCIVSEPNQTCTPETFIKTITRVAKKGCVLLVGPTDSPDNTREGFIPQTSFEQEKTSTLFRQYGWEKTTICERTIFVLT